MISYLKKLLFKIFKNQLFPGSKNYWEKRYANQGTSGPGSYNRLAEFKANFLNEFVRDKDIKSIAEFGCGDGNQLSLAAYPSYIGVDVSETAIQLCKQTFIQDTQKQFYLYGSEAYKQSDINADLSLSLDVIYHLIEDSVFEAHMHDLFKTAKRYVIIYASNFDKKQSFHERDRKFTDWVDSNQAAWELTDTVKNPYPFAPENPDNTSKADFYIYQKE